MRVKIQVRPNDDDKSIRGRALNRQWVDLAGFVMVQDKQGRNWQVDIKDIIAIKRDGTPRKGI